MKVTRIAHAGLIVSTGSVQCVMDPLLFNEFEGGANQLHPKIGVNFDLLRKNTDLLILSHHHLDHFCPKSLNIFDRNTPILFPARDNLIDSALIRMGFKNRKPIEIFDEISFGNLKMFPTLSRVSFPEMGVLFKTQNKSFWNIVDSTIDEDIIDYVKMLTKSVDLVFAPYMPMIEQQIALDSLGASFPIELYSDFLRNIRNISPKCIVPSACGYKTIYSKWKNNRQFPMTADQFLSDVKAMLPKSLTRNLGVGESILLNARFSVQNGKHLGVFPVDGERTSRYDWRPDRGLPDLSDLNLPQYSIRELKKRLKMYLDRDFLVSLNKLKNTSWRKSLKDAMVKWRLEIVFPDNGIETRVLDFGKVNLRWREPTRNEFFKLHHSIAASALLGLTTGEVPLHATLGDMSRRFSRMYAVSNDGIRTIQIEDPLVKVLLAGSDERRIDRLLQEIRL